MKLDVSCYEETDTLSFWDREPAQSADDIADNPLVNYNANGEAVGYTLDHAAEILLPILQPALKSRKDPTGKPSKLAKSSS
ncbi:MAG: hypothetical protein OXN21_01070 [Chloroflexota bacterium]|nr:hypothetical protein [Chloroflexota bacterium]